MAIATYTFLPWLRRGIANRLQASAGAGASRAVLQVGLSITSEQGRLDPPPVAVQLVGPGDVTGLQSRQVIRTEPRANIADFEANYLAAIDFYDEDFPWRYSPLAPDGATHRLPPWIVLVVLKDGEFTRKNIPDRPLPSFVLTPAARRVDLFPVLGQEWAWAHVHLNEKLGGAPAAPDLAQLGAALEANPDIGYARLLSPRKLDPNTSYTAVVTPAFEVGRKAGLGEAVADTDDGSIRSWVGAADEFPIYYEWNFRTGVDGDFESLVRALVPRDMDPRVGIRDMDIAHPGFGVDDVVNPPDNLVGLEGALLAPTTVRKGLAAGSDYVPQVEPVLNAPADARADGDADPLVSPPIYGCWPAQVERVSSEPADAGWVNSLNLDPRYRAAAGLGSRVIRANQEKYMRTAWDQIGDVLTVNHKIRRAQLAIKAAASAYTKSTVTLPRDRLLALASPIFTKVLGSPKTLAALVKTSRVPRAAVSPALRKQLRPRGRMAKRFLADDVRANGVGQIIAGISSGTHTAAPPRPPAGGATIEDTNATVPAPLPSTTVSKFPWQLWLLLLVLVVPLFFIALWLGLIAAVVGAIVIVTLWRGSPSSGGGSPESAPPPPAVLLSPANLTPAAIADTPARAAFVFAGPGTEGTLPASSAPPPGPPSTPGDSLAAADMRRALIDFHDAFSARVAPAPLRPALDLELVGQKALVALEPHGAFARRFAPQLRISGLDVLTYTNDRYFNGSPSDSAGGGTAGTFREIMNYPDIKDPMCVPLDAVSSEYFVPNLKLIPNNTISLMQTNQPFIESYLVGLNHEFARELLWREYPTDQQGSYFRQFWDVSNFVDRDNRTPKQLAEDLKDIPRIHEWTAQSALGSHNQRDAQGDQRQVVLVLRGDLLKRYPNTFIYAQKAAWGTGNRADRLILSDESGELLVTAPKDPRLRFPLYQARVSPDITFIGFDLTLEEVRGDPLLDETAAARAVVGDNLGWFFVLQEVVGEPRFGMDLGAPIDPSSIMWDNLAWTNLDLGGGQAIDVAKPFVSSPAGTDHGVAWGSNAADMAFILYQEPVLVGVHGRTMLKNLKPPA